MDDEKRFFLYDVIFLKIYIVNYIIIVKFGGLTLLKKTYLNYI